jgi:hypothetical protein
VQAHGSVPSPVRGEPVRLRQPTRPSARPYQRHEADKTVLYQIVSEQLETFVDEVRDHYEKPLPAYVEKELRDFLQCGLLPYGFLRARCKTCGKELLVALSCKRLGVCCSCNARRMCGTAAHLTDRVIPDVPLRQWVLSVPYELRLLLARHADALSAVGRIFIQEILRFQRQQAQIHRLGHARGAAVLFPQRFGSSLNVNIHYHAAVPDGVFVLDEQHDRATFHPLAPPDPVDLDTLALNVDLRATRWLERHHLLERPNEVDSFSQLEPERTPLEACLEGSLGIGELTTLRAGQAVQEDEQPPPMPRPSRSARRTRANACRWSDTRRSSPDGDGRSRRAVPSRPAQAHVDGRSGPRPVRCQAHALLGWVTLPLTLPSSSVADGWPMAAISPGPAPAPSWAPAPMRKAFPEPPVEAKLRA